MSVRLYFPALLIGLMALTAAANTTFGQVLERPDRPGPPPPDQSRPWQTLTFGVNALGGYDDNVVASVGSVDPLSPAQSGYSGFGDTSIRFRRGGGTRNPERGASLFEIGGRGYVNSMRYVRAGATYGADARASISAPLGRRHRIDASEAVSSDPLYVPAGFAVLRSDLGAVPSPDANPLNGLEARRSVSNGSAIGITSQLWRRNTVTASYRYDSRQFRDQIGDTRAHSGLIVYRRSVGRRSGLRAAYTYANSEFEIVGGTTPTVSHTADVGYEHEQRFSSTRAFFVSVGAGAADVSSQLILAPAVSRRRIDFVAPTGFGAVRWSWARTWSLSGDYRRAVAALAGLSAEAFVTNAAVARLGGFVQHRVDVVASAGYSQGQSGGGGVGSFSTYTVSSQLRYRIGRQVAAMVSHTYYRYSLQNVAGVPGFPTQMDRNAIRIGISVDAPIHRSRNAPPLPLIG